MYKLCKTEQSTKRQREIELELQKMMLEKRYDDISISELCERLSMPRKAFYRYFDSKDGALHALIDHTLLEFQNFGSQYTERERRSLRGDLEQFFIFWERRKAFLDALERSSLTGLLLHASLSFSVSDMINPTKFLPEETDWMRSQVFQFAICGLMSFMLEWYRGGFVEKTRDMAAAAGRMLSEPLFPTLSELGLIDTAR